MKPRHPMARSCSPIHTDLSSWIQARVCSHIQREREQAPRSQGIHSNVKFIVQQVIFQGKKKKKGQENQQGTDVGNSRVLEATVCFGAGGIFFLSGSPVVHKHFRRQHQLYLKGAQAASDPFLELFLSSLHSFFSKRFPGQTSMFRNILWSQPQIK